MSDDHAANPRTLGKCICIITGASKGFGRALACEVSRSVMPGSILLMVARSGMLLQELKEELQSFTEEHKLVIRCITADLTTREGVNDTVAAVRQEAADEMDHVLLVNNAASLGDISRFVNFTDFDKVNLFLSFNVSSALALTAGILKALPCRAGLRWTVVNVSSLFALQAMPSWVLYCTAKAAREMMFRVLAEEEPNIKVLSYSPGPMDTEMQQEILRLTGVSRHLLPCQEPAAKLTKLLLDNSFASGTHHDFFED